MGSVFKSKRVGLAAMGVAVISVAGIGASVANADVLFTDNFTVNYPDANPPVTTTDTNNLNLNLSAREGGTLGAGGGVQWSGSGNAQIGNTTGDINNGNYLLTAFGGTASPNANFVGSETGPVTISFDEAVNVLGSTDTTVWGAILVGLDQAHQLSYINAGNSNDFGILFRSNGGIQAFQGSSVITGGDASATWDGGTGTSDHTTDMNPFSLVISGQNGTGSGFAGNGTEIQVYAGSNLIATYSTAAGGGLTNALTSNYINFGNVGSTAAGTENLSISEATPEPTAMGLFALGGLGLMLVRRKGPSRRV